MQSTTITVSEDTKEQIAQYRDPDHDNWDEVISDVLSWVPGMSDFDDGCAECGTPVGADERIANIDGVVQRNVYSVADGEYIEQIALYCSADCLQTVEERAKKHVPKHPDKVRIGGVLNPEVTLGGAEFRIDGEQRWISLPIPGAFAGEDEDGQSYNYTGEPVYVINDGDVVQSGVVREVTHEDAHTTILLGKDIDTEDEHRPVPAEDDVVEAVEAVIDDNPGAVSDYRDGEGGAINYLVGQVMQSVDGSADPTTVNKLLCDRLNE